MLSAFRWWGLEVEMGLSPAIGNDTKKLPKRYNDGSEISHFLTAKLIGSTCI
jgi:hypothetical protein